MRLRMARLNSINNTHVFYVPDVLHALIGVGMINWDDQREVASLEKGNNLTLYSKLANPVKV